MEPGETAHIVLKYSAAQTRDVIVRLVKGSQFEASVRQTAPEGRGVVPVNITVPATAPSGNDYRWLVHLTPHGASWSSALAAQSTAGVFIDDRMAGAGTIRADNPDIIYAGRWDLTVPNSPTCYWGGSQIQTRFRGTSIAANWNTSEGNEFLAVLDGDHDNPLRVKVSNGHLAIATGLSNGIHTLMLMKNTECGDPVKFLGFTLDTGCGLLRPEPLPERRIEFYGDSTVSGGIPDAAKPNPDPNQDGDYLGDFDRTFCAFTARQLGADWRPISKGGTGVAGSFVVSYTLLDYWNLLGYDGWHPETGPKWDFSRWKPDVVVVAIGQNDRFRSPSVAAFATAYQQFLSDLHSVYPKAQIFCTNTSMSPPDPLWKAAVVPILAQCPWVHFQLFDPNQSHAGHPRLIDHQQMASGNSEWYGLANWIGDVMNW